MLLHIQAILPNHWHTVHRQTILPNHWHTVHIQAILPNHWHRQFCQITGMLLNILAILPNHWHTPPHTGNSAKSLAQCCPPQTDNLPKNYTSRVVQNCMHGTLLHIASSTGNSAKSLANAILPNHWHTGSTPCTGNHSAKSLAHSSTYRQFCQITGTAQAILPNHWHTHPRSGNSAKSLAHCLQTDNAAKSLARSSTYLQFCQITGTLLHILAILPKHWYTPQNTGNSVKSHWLAGTGYSAKSLAHSSAYRQLCKINGTLCTGNSAKSLAQAILPNHWGTLSNTDSQFCQRITGTLSTDRHQFCQITGTLSSTYRQFCQMTGTFLHQKHAILPNQWHSTAHRQTICQSTSRVLRIKAILLQNHWHAPPCSSAYRQFCQITGDWHMQFCQITGTPLVLLIQAILPNHWHTTPPHTGNSAK